MSLRNIFILIFITILVKSSLTTTFQAQANSTTLYVQPQLTSIEVSQTCRINISISQVQDLAGWEFKIYYPNSILNATNIEEGPFLRAVSNTIYLLVDFNDNYNATHGRIWAACALQGSGSGAGGNGTLATITFKAKCAGNANLTLKDTELIDSQMPNPNHIPHSTIDGIIRVVLGLRDSAITNVTPLKTIVGQGYTANINVTVENQGAYSETFNVSLYASRPDVGVVNIKLFGASNSTTNGWGFTINNMTIPGPTIIVKKGDTINLTLTSVDGITHNFFVDYDGDTKPNSDEPISPDFPGPPHNLYTINFKFKAEKAGTFKYYSSHDKDTMYGDFIVEEPTILTTEIGKKGITLNAGLSAILTFTWNTTGYAKGNYTISAYAWPVQGEIDTDDNTFVDGQVKIGVPGDVNNDRKVDMTDIGIILRAYGTTPTSPNWNPNNDINNDNKVDMTDVGIALRNYGKTE